MTELIGDIGTYCLEMLSIMNNKEEKNEANWEQRRRVKEHTRNTKENPSKKLINNCRSLCKLNTNTSKPVSINECLCMPMQTYKSAYDIHTYYIYDTHVCICIHKARHKSTRSCTTYRKPKMSTQSHRNLPLRLCQRWSEFLICGQTAAESIRKFRQEQDRNTWEHVRTHSDFV